MAAFLLFQIEDLLFWQLEHKTTWFDFNFKNHFSSKTLAYLWKFLFEFYGLALGLQDLTEKLLLCLKTTLKVRPSLS